MSYSITLTPDTRVTLSDYDPAHTGGLSHDAGMAELARLSAELSTLQELLYAAHNQSVLIILQGLDTSGKDGTIKHVMGQINPQGCQVASFKVPTPWEAAHDFLWRCHQVTPARGMIGIFNRSYYEDVLVTRVHHLIPPDVCHQRYKHINHFESLLADAGTIVLKFFLHISKKEQKERLLAREDDADKSWKLSATDWQERRYWDDYVAAYEDALSACTTDTAPWIVVPADVKWYRNLAVAEKIVHTLRPLKDTWIRDLEARGREALAAIQATRAGQDVDGDADKAATDSGTQTSGRGQK